MKSATSVGVISVTMCAAQSKIFKPSPSAEVHLEHSQKHTIYEQMKRTPHTPDTHNPSSSQLMPPPNCTATLKKLHTLCRIETRIAPNRDPKIAHVTSKTKNVVDET